MAALSKKEEELKDLQIYYAALDKMIETRGSEMTDEKIQSYYRARYQADLDIQSLKISIAAENLSDATKVVETELMILNQELKSKI